MDPKHLKALKQMPKRLEDAPQFKPLRRGRLPRPLDKMGGARMQATEFIALGNEFHLCFAWRDGHLLADSTFMAWLFLGKPGKLSPLAIMHYHPSHKPVHMLTPCHDQRDFTNRELPGVSEFDLTTQALDPRRDADRQYLIALFCRRCGVSLGTSSGLPL